jgi:hypothetical protein
VLVLVPGPVSQETSVRVRIENAEERMIDFFIARIVSGFTTHSADTRLDTRQDCVERSDIISTLILLAESKDDSRAICVGQVSIMLLEFL